MEKITKKQHYVPDFYLRQWSNALGKVIVHDLITKTARPYSPTSILHQKFFYEEDAENPDNRIENLLSSIENRCGVTFKKLRDLGQQAVAEPNEKKAAALVRDALTDEDITNILDFAIYQYLRVPGSIDQKEYETQVSAIAEADRQHALNPGRFVESGYAYVHRRFKGLKMIIFVSPGREFITSDWPCFDLKDSDTAPLLGEDIGRDPRVVCYMPLTPMLGAVFMSPDFSDNVARAKTLTVVKQKDIVVRNQNALIVQQAEFRVVASREEKYIFSMADKRKKSRT